MGLDYIKNRFKLILTIEYTFKSSPNDRLFLKSILAIVFANKKKIVYKL